MHLVQILLPLRDNEGGAFPPDLYAQVRRTLKERFGGMTAYSRAPAEGSWKDGEETVRDDIVVLEVMAGRLEADWWRAFRQNLEGTFRQDTIIVRAQALTML